MPEPRGELKLFSPDAVGSFVERPNRFVIVAEVEGKRLKAHCPNPGRMHEILIPGTRVILEKSDTPDRSTGYTFVAAIHRGEVIALHSTRANIVAEKLILPVLIKDSESIRREAVFGGSRFDFAVKTKKGTVLVEVKSCTLCEGGVAMFPDAPTIRGVKHLTEMAGIVRAGMYREEKIAGGLVLFVIGHPNPRVFIPNIHTDTVFSTTLKEISDVLSIHACSIAVTEGGVARVVNNDVPVGYGPVSLISEDRGVYLITLFLKEDKNVHTGALGQVLYRRGWYVYVGSAKRGLSARIRRHLSRRKTCRWHIDYLSLAADSLRGYASARTRSYPIYTDRDLECGLAKSVHDAGGAGVDRFGSSDCSCKSHLYWFEKNPLQISAFADMLFSYRHIHGLENFLGAAICRRER